MTVLAAVLAWIAAALLLAVIILAACLNSCGNDLRQADRSVRALLKQRDQALDENRTLLLRLSEQARPVVLRPATPEFLAGPTDVYAVIAAMEAQFDQPGRGEPGE